MAIAGKGRPTKAQAEESKYLQSWLSTISGYEREFKSWEGRVEKIIKRYRDERTDKSGETARFNILWSNVQTLLPATFSRIPQPDVSRRFRDNDPIGRVASLILERALEFEINHYPDYKATLTQSISDRFLGGRGTAWARYEPHITAVQKQLPEDGNQVTEDADEADEDQDEQLEYECAPIDYVHWKDFGHSVARTWEEVTRVWRKVYLTRSACIERFGEDLGNKIPLDSTPDDLKNNKQQESSEHSRALVIEGWDKETGQAVWISKTLKMFLDKKDDPLNLEGFFPCPKPIYATITNETLVPIPDFALYQDQAKELDTLSDRIDGLVKALQVKGCYDATIPEIGRLFTEASNTSMVPVTNWGAFAEKQGLAGAISLVDLKPIAEALREAYGAMDQIKSQVYEITGISDIIRGTTEASETATAQQIKGRYATLRLKSYQDEVAEFATQCLRLKAQIMCGKFDPESLTKISAAEQLSEEDQQYIQPAIQLLVGDRLSDPELVMGHYDNPVRSFRIEIAADTLVQIDEDEDKRSRMEFLQGIGAFLKEALPVAQGSPEMVPLLMSMLRFAVTGYKVGKTIEGAFDDAEQKIRQAAMQPKTPPPNPEMIKMQAEQQRQQMEDQREQQRQAMEAQREQQKQQNEMFLKQQQAREDAAFARFEALLKARTAIEVAEIGANTTLQTSQMSAAQQGVQ